MLSRISLTVLAVATGALQSCSSLGPCDTSDDGNPTQDWRGGNTSRGVYMSSPWTGPLLSFPGGSRYQLFHELGHVPSLVVVWVSFSEHGTVDSNVAMAAGNLAEVQEINDQMITIKNETCSDMYVLVTATAGDATEPDGGGVSGDGG